MKTKTRAKIQEALDTLKPWLPHSQHGKIAIVNEAYEALATEPDEPTVSKEIVDATKYATNLVESMVKDWPHNPNWKPLPDLIGLLTQIDNMVAGMVVKSKPSTVSKSVEELVFKIRTVLENPLLKSKYRPIEASKLIQQFLDAQIAERNTRIETLLTAIKAVISAFNDDHLGRGIINELEDIVISEVKQ